LPSSASTFLMIRTRGVFGRITYRALSGNCTRVRNRNRGQREQTQAKFSQHLLPSLFAPLIIFCVALVFYRPLRWGVAVSTNRDSRMTVTLISPGNCTRSVSALTMSRQIFAAVSSVDCSAVSSTRISRPA